MVLLELLETQVRGFVPREGNKGFPMMGNNTGAATYHILSMATQAWQAHGQTDRGQDECVK